MIWDNEISGVYSTQSGHYWLLSHMEELPAEPSWKWIWRLHASPGFSVMIPSPVRKFLHNRGIPVEKVCPKHYFLVSNGDNKWWGEIPCNSLEVWKRRNITILYAKEPDIRQVISSILALTDIMSKVFPSSSNSNRPEPHWLGWSCPSNVQFVLSSDGSAIFRSAEFGGLIRNKDGSWIIGYYGGIDEADIIEAEIQAILHGLHVWNKCADLLVKLGVYAND
ncbi:putative ribonuclease H protein [Sesbania bispinosa]|nr:putative ribonuclease H protein [Sesbania bispinosa]